MNVNDLVTHYGSPALLMRKCPSYQEDVARLVHTALTTRAFKRAKPARPYIWRLMVFTRWTECPDRHIPYVG